MQRLECRIQFFSIFISCADDAKWLFGCHQVSKSLVESTGDPT